MPRHRRRRLGPFVTRSRYLDLWVRYQELLQAHQVLEGDHQGVLEDHEGLLYELENGPEAPEPTHALESPVRPHPVPSWAQTEELPVVGLDAPKADALVRRTGLLEAPGGSWRVTPQENG